MGLALGHWMLKETIPNKVLIQTLLIIVSEASKIKNIRIVFSKRRTVSGMGFTFTFFCDAQPTLPMPRFDCLSACSSYLVERLYEH